MILDVVCGLIFDGSGQLLITQRSPHTSHPLDWEFPGGKRHANESLIDALYRELKEEINIDCLSASHFLTHYHRYPDYEVNLHAFRVEGYQGEVSLNEDQAGFRWVALDALNQFVFPEANQVIIQKLVAAAHAAILTQS